MQERNDINTVLQTRCADFKVWHWKVWQGKELRHSTSNMSKYNVLKKRHLLSRVSTQSTIYRSTISVRLLVQCWLCVKNNCTHRQPFCTIIWHGNTWSCACFRGSSMPHPKGGRASPKIFGPPTCMHIVWERATKFCMVIKLDERKIFTGSTTPPALAKICVTRMLTRNVLMVVNLCTSPINCCCNTLGSITVIPIKQLIFQTFPQHSSS